MKKYLVFFMVLALMPIIAFAQSEADAEGRITVVARFSGASLDVSEQDALIQDIQMAIDDYGVPMDLVLPEDAPDNNPYNLLVTLTVNPRQNNMVANLTLALRRNTRNLKQSKRHTYTEMNMEFVIRRGGEEIRKDRDFFQSLVDIIEKLY